MASLWTLERLDGVIPTPPVGRVAPVPGRWSRVRLGDCVYHQRLPPASDQLFEGQSLLIRGPGVGDVPLSLSPQAVTSRPEDRGTGGGSRGPGKAQSQGLRGPHKPQATPVM